MEYLIHGYKNGIRLVHKQVKSPVAHFGVIVHTGSRDEKENEHGMAHLIEHMIFKGTPKRKAYHILTRLEDVGGELNAFTTKEETCIYSSFLKQDYERAIELMYDIFFHSTFPEKELKLEKNVIIDEILSYLDTPSELIFDDFEEQVFNNSSIGRNILGTRKNLESFSREDIFSFVTDNYASTEIVLSSVGNIEFNALIALCQKYFGEEKDKKRIRPRISPDGYDPVSRSIDKKTYQIHCITGNLAYKINDKRRTGLHLLTNLLGGPGNNSRLNMSLRERNGYTYQIEAHYTPYTDTGVFLVYFGCEKGNFEKSLELIHKEFRNIRDNKLGSLQLNKAMKQLIGQIAINSESNEHLMLSIGKSLLALNRVDSLEEITRKIESVTAGQIMDIANEILQERCLSLIKYY